MSIFKEIYGTRCLGQTDPQCPNFINQKLLPPTKRFCDCASKVAPMERTNWKTVGIAAALVLLGVGGSAYAAYNSTPLSRLFGLLHSGAADEPPAYPSGDPQVSLQIVLDGGGSVPFDHAFQTGDAFRFKLRGPSSDRVYTFYEDRQSHKMMPLAAGPALDPAADTS